ncbi:hypothetical protein [Streptomyces cyaneofuscatus]|uniref:hypothetical protein n=1 Tax=Streptomyces cyaneofuscatus TaxID=66883 RepID=UPI0037AC65B6
MTSVYQQDGQLPAAVPGPVRTRVDLHTTLPGELAEEVERRLLFVSAEISGFQLIVENGAVVGAVLESDAPLDRASLAEKINRVVDGDVRDQRTTLPKVVWTSPHEHTTEEGTFELLHRSGMVGAARDGLVALGEPLLSLLDHLDNAVKGLLRQDFAPVEFRYPTLISTQAMEATGYLASFPHHLMFVTRLHNDIDVYQEFQRSHEERGLDSTVLDSCRNVDYCLPPTMCYHTFDQYRDRTLPAEGLHVVTAKGKAFRFEAGYATSLERLWDFTIREIVFMGEREEVLAARRRFMQRTFAFIEDLGLAGFCEVGNDPFFGGPDTSTRIWSQKLMELKYELRIPVAPERTVAAASFNFHDDLFGEKFGIGYGPDATVRSACVGFGLERLAYAFLCRHGLDVDAWPASVRAGVQALSGI